MRVLGQPSINPFWDLSTFLWWIAHDVPIESRFIELQVTEKSVSSKLKKNMLWVLDACL